MAFHDGCFLQCLGFELRSWDMSKSVRVSLAKTRTEIMEWIRTAEQNNGSVC